MQTKCICPYIQKSRALKLQMLTIPSHLVSNQSAFDKLFFGKKNTDTEIPVSAYNIKNNTLTYTEYASDGLKGD